VHQLLQAAWRSHRTEGVCRLGAWALVGFGLLCVTVAAALVVLTQPGPTLTTVSLVGGLVPWLLAAALSRRARAAGRGREHALDEAWLTSAESVLPAGGHGLSMAALGRRMGAQSEDAEEWLRGLGARDRIVTRVTEAGDVAYSTRGTEPTSDVPPSQRGQSLRSTHRRGD